MYKKAHLYLEEALQNLIPNYNNIKPIEPTKAIFCFAKK